MKSNIIALSEYVKIFATHFDDADKTEPWQLVKNIAGLVKEKFRSLNSDYKVSGNIAIHKNATIEEHVILKEPLIICDGCHIAAHAYLRGGVFLAPHVVVGPGCEIKSSFIMDNSAIAHFNFVGDSIIGADVNMEAGAVIANHFNERLEKTIYVSVNNIVTAIASNKFGALVGDGVRIGANAVLSPGTILKPGQVVKRLELVQQCD